MTAAPPHRSCGDSSVYHGPRCEPASWCDLEVTIAGGGHRGNMYW
ncbi:hypothetical protein GMORB2_7584 [Geosmithia morbida]|uniref:Uncharacterized protein n=1 Tax=Geosmithia morbida TaxID=1094350 RepID=A0A9P4YUL8_9HYPO|nr:uncharacterized protein GMORB2_7584 [Geosmithia morbida]KAF4121991.1 hypothetical protein GMORB2_7584 [Geosmithia morbida]